MTHSYREFLPLQMGLIRYGLLFFPVFIQLPLMIDVSLPIHFYDFQLGVWGCLLGNKGTLIIHLGGLGATQDQWQYLHIVLSQIHLEEAAFIHQKECKNSFLKKDLLDEKTFSKSCAKVTLARDCMNESWSRDKWASETTAVDGASEISRRFFSNRK